MAMVTVMAHGQSEGEVEIVVRVGDGNGHELEFREDSQQIKQASGRRSSITTRGRMSFRVTDYLSTASGWYRFSLVPPWSPERSQISNLQFILNNTVKNYLSLEVR